MKRKPKKSLKPKTVPTLTSLSEWTGKTRRTVQSWSNDPSFPTEGDDSGFSPFLVGVWYATDGPGASARDAEEAALCSGETTPNLERWRYEKYRLAKLQRQQLEKTLVPLPFVHQTLMLIAAKIRSFGEKLQASDAEQLQLVIEDIRREASQWEPANAESDVEDPDA